MKLYLIRHGESESNLSKCWGGWTNPSLTEKGKADARLVRDVLRGVQIDKVITSDLTRAMQTAEIALPGCSYETLPLIREVDVGNLGGTPYADTSEEMRAEIAANGYAAAGGESKEDFARRAKEFLALMEKETCAAVAAFSHGGFLRVVLDEVVGLYLPRKSILCANCAVCVVEYTGGEWQLHSWINVT